MGCAAPPGLRDHEGTDGPLCVLALDDAVLRVNVVWLRFRLSGGNSGGYLVLFVCLCLFLSLSQCISLPLSVFVLWKEK